MIAAENNFINNIKELESLNWMIYPTGSRFFGNCTEKSDWDFMVNEEAKNQLLSLGYIIIDNPMYEDGTPTMVLGKDNFHIQLYDIETLALMLKVRNSIQRNVDLRMLYWKLDKADKKILWKGLLSLQKNQK